MVNLLQMIFQIFKGSLTFKKLVNNYFGGTIEAFYWSANRVAVIGNHHKKKPTGKYLGKSSVKIHSYKYSVCFKKHHEKITNICK